MGRDDDRIADYFVRFKQHVDTTISSGLGILLTLGITHPTSGSRQPDTVSSAESASAELISNRSALSPAPIRTCIMDTPRPKPQSHGEVLSVLSPSYFPSSLRHLPQPVPSDLPSDMDSSIFTFEDAFEDLLAISREQQLSDICTKYHQRQLLRNMFPSGEPMWFWLRRLESQGLIQAPIQSRGFRVHQPDWSAFHQELDQKAANTWRRLARVERANDKGSDDFFQELGGITNQVERNILSENDSYRHTDLEQGSQQIREPKTFDELFSAISSNFKESATSWDTFVNAINGRPNPEVVEDHPSHEGDKNVETSRKEYVDRFGYLHKTVTRRTLDENGNELKRETHVTLRPANNAADNHLTNDNMAEGSAGASDAGIMAGKTSSWFWK